MNNVGGGFCSIEGKDESIGARSHWEAVTGGGSWQPRLGHGWVGTIWHQHLSRKCKVRVCGGQCLFSVYSMALIQNLRIY